MRTVCCSSHLLGGGVCLSGCLPTTGGCLPATGECLPARGVSASQEGVCLPGGGVSAQEGVCLPRGMSACQWGVCLPGGCLADPPWTEFLTHACGNITFPQLRLRTVLKDLYCLIFLFYFRPTGDSRQNITLTFIIIIIMYFILLLPAEVINFAKLQIEEKSEMTDNFNLGEYFWKSSVTM